jgi:sterol desaturase/sphingolipid hydroxylase (fatty acid hydroxylase superfamily)
MNRILPYTLYPLTLIAAALAYLLTFELTHLHLLGLYSGVSLSAIIIFTAEKFFPLHREWIPTKEELIIDIFFYSVIVQVIFPFALYFAGITILEFLGFKEGIIFDIWPHHFSKITQFLILAISGEFFQYWWHRLCHTYKFLWPVHAPHHFQKKLYSWNTTRFHFFDKFVEFFFTIFIFLSLGLSVEILSYYYLFYAITGYIQHSNLDIKLGWMDYIIASGETHRFHHDSNLSASKCNYANNFVLFDLLFKTFKRNPGEKNPVVGMNSKNTPIGVIEETQYPISHFKDEFFQLILKNIMESVAGEKVKQLQAATNDPKAIQNSRLLEILQKNEETIFGIEHDFKNIKTVEQFQKNVPIRDYEEHRPYIEMIFKGETNALSTLPPHYFTKTSGTTGKPKYIPINMDIQKSYISSQQILSHSLFKKDSRYLSGEIFSVVGNECEEILYDKWPCGSMSGKLYSLAHKSIKAKHIFEKDIATLNDSEKMYFYLAALALLSPNTTFYVSPNPSTLLKIFEVINSKRPELLKLIEDGIDPIIKKHSRKFDHAVELLNLQKDLKVTDVWPNLHILSLWMEGSCSYLIPRVKNLIGPKTQLAELGFLCSEFYGTLPVDSDTNKQVPTLLNNYFEFIEKNAYESGNRETLGLHELKLGNEYYIIVTTIGCFYRYFINDIIKVTGFYNQTPTIVFSQKGKGITNITGEKISEKQLVSFFEELNGQEQMIKFFICLADQVNQNYALYLETDSKLSIEKLEHDLDQHLKNVNVEYASKVSSQRLQPIKIHLLEQGTLELYRTHCIKKGQSEVQFKFLYLQYLSNVDFPFRSHIKK